MKTMLIEILQSNIRVFLLTCFSMGMALTIDCMLMRRLRKLYAIAIYLVVKTFIVNDFVGNGLLYYYIDVQWLKTLYQVLVCICAVLTYVFYYITFEGSIAKVAIGALIGETVSAFCIEVAVFVPNAIVGRKLFVLIGDFHAADILAFLICGMFLLLIYLFGRKILYRYRDYKLKHESLWTFMGMSLICIYTVSLFVEFDSGYQYWPLVVIIFSALVIAFIFYKHYTSGLRIRNSYLRLQQRLSSAHYTVIQEQISRMEQSQRQIRDNMREIEHMKEAGDLQSAKVSAYLKDIRREYEQIRAEQEYTAGTG